MTSEEEALQGSLFGENPLLIHESYSSNQEKNALKEGLSDEQLAEDANKRPRQRNILYAPDISESSSIDQDLDSSLPKWSSHKLIDIDLLTPVLKHYVSLKKANPERILLYRLGDFFECFFEDAIQLSRVLEIALTGKDAGKKLGRVPMAGIPHHAIERYSSELIRRGLSVALCDQIETSPNKGSLLKREITRVLTPGTIIEEGMLQAKKNNWLVALLLDNENIEKELYWGLARADISTGDFIITQDKGEISLHQELSKTEPSELICAENDELLIKKYALDKFQIKSFASTPFTKPEANKLIEKHYKVNTTDGIGFKEWPLAMRAAGGLLAYLNDTQALNSNQKKDSLSSKSTLDLPRIVLSKDSLILDSQTRKNLELTSTQKNGQFQGSLLWAIDRTLTSMGARCLRRWIESPLVDANQIQERQELVSSFVQSRLIRQKIRKIMRAMSDLERLAGRAGAGHAGARDVIAIADGLERLPLLAKQLININKNQPKWFKDLKSVDSSLLKLAQNIRNQIISNPPLSITDGGIIHDGVDPVLDGIRNQIDDNSKWLNNQEIIERKNSRNSNLRIQYHRTFGYFISVTKAKANTVPDHWIRRQTLANEERFITPELKENEGKIFQAKARASQREYELFVKLRDEIGNYATLIRKAARGVAALDAIISLAEIAATSSYCAPKIISQLESQENGIIDIKDCRHPVVEQLLVEKSFQPNNINIGNGVDLIILTGPNASGKSCYLRQIGLIQLLAQIGSWVPAKKACLSISDRIFTRVGAIDDLAAGQSTFMVEMIETAQILNQATNKSLVLLDEIGRGTATFDGLSIAWAVSEYLSEEIKSKTIFATHYHELNSLTNISKNIVNFQVLVEEKENELLFLHKVVPGGASRSYGIEAARLAGVPLQIIQRSKDLLEKLENKKDSKKG